MENLPLALDCVTLATWRRVGKISDRTYSNYLKCEEDYCTGTSACNECRKMLFKEINKVNISDSFKNSCKKEAEIEMAYLERQTQENTMYYPLATLSKEKQFIVVNKHDNGEISFHETMEEARDYATRRLQQDSEYLVLKLAATVRPKPLDADIEEY